MNPSENSAFATTVTTVFDYLDVSAELFCAYVHLPETQQYFADERSISHRFSVVSDVHDAEQCTRVIVTNVVYNTYSIQSCLASCLLSLPFEDAECVVTTTQYLDGSMSYRTDVVYKKAWGEAIPCMSILSTVQKTPSSENANRFTVVEEITITVNVGWDSRFVLISKLGSIFNALVASVIVSVQNLGDDAPLIFRKYLREHGIVRCMV